MIRDMDIIITMGGLGSRFARAGYTVPKYRIEAKGKTLFEWSLDSLSGYNAGVGKYVFIMRREDGAADLIRDADPLDRSYKEAPVSKKDMGETG